MKRNYSLAQTKVATWLVEGCLRQAVELLEDGSRVKETVRLYRGKQLNECGYSKERDKKRRSKIALFVLAENYHSSAKTGKAENVLFLLQGTH
jgi:hypothetical protein